MRSPAGRRRGRTALRLWHRLLSAGTSDVAQLRGWDRLITWDSHATARARRRAVKLFLKLPVRAVKHAYVGVREYGAEISHEARVSRGRQFLQLWWLRVRHGMSAKAYVDYQLYRRDRWRRAGDYVEKEEFYRVNRFVQSHTSVDDAARLADKGRFDAWCREHGFPTVPTLLEIREGRVTQLSLAREADATALPPCDLFSKPADSAGGFAAARWVYDGQGGYAGGDGRTRQPAELLEELTAMSRNLAKRGTSWRPMVVQPRLRNHRALLPLTPGGLCTIRLQTYRCPRRETRLLLGVYKMPVGDAPADNFHFGGVVAPVDLTTGRLGSAIFRRGKVIVAIERHPTTGASIEGYQLPFWEDTLRLVHRAHDAVPTLPTVGWDVALLEEGPILVEGNNLPSAAIAQTPSGVPFGATPLVRCVNAYARECFGL